MNFFSGMHLIIVTFTMATFYIHCADIEFKKDRYTAPAGSAFAPLPSDVMLCIINLSTNTKQDRLALRTTCTGFAKAYLFIRQSPLSFDLTYAENKFKCKRSHTIYGLLASGALHTDRHIDLFYMNVSGFALFCSAITHLAKLDLRDNHICADGTQYLSDALKENSTLTNLNFGGNNVGADGAKDLSDALTNNSALTNLNLGSNNIGADGAEHLSDMLKNNSTLTNLDLYNNEIGADGAQYLSDALKNNSILTNLYLSYNAIGNDGAKYLSDALKKNTTLRKLDLRVTSINSQELVFDKRIRLW